MTTEPLTPMDMAASNFAVGHLIWIDPESNHVYAGRFVEVYEVRPGDLICGQPRIDPALAELFLERARAQGRPVRLVEECDDDD